MKQCSRDQRGAGAQGGGMSEVAVRGLTKCVGRVTAVRGVSFTAPAGKVTGFLGPNGSGKTTTLRVVVGLVRPDAGAALIGGVPYGRLARPRRTVGALLEASGFHPGRRARDHLLVLADAAGIPGPRVDEVLGQVGLAPAGECASSPSACGSGSAWPVRCSATRGCCCLTNRPTASTRLASPGSAAC